MNFLNKITEFKDFITYQALTVDESMNSRINRVAVALLKPLEFVLSYHNKSWMRKFTVNPEVNELSLNKVSARWQIIAAYLTFIPATIIAINLKLLNRFINEDLISKSNNLITDYKTEESKYSPAERYVFGGYSAIRALPDIGPQSVITSHDNIYREFPRSLFGNHNVIRGTWDTDGTPFIAVKYTKNDFLRNTPNMFLEGNDNVVVMTSGMIIGYEWGYVGTGFNNEEDLTKFKELISTGKSPEFKYDYEMDKVVPTFRSNGEPVYVLGHTYPPLIHEVFGPKILTARDVGNVENLERIKFDEALFDADNIIKGTWGPLNNKFFAIRFTEYRYTSDKSHREAALKNIAIVYESDTSDSKIEWIIESKEVWPLDFEFKWDVLQNLVMDGESADYREINKKIVDLYRDGGGSTYVMGHA